MSAQPVRFAYKSTYRVAELVSASDPYGVKRSIAGVVSTALGIALILLEMRKDLIAIRWSGRSLWLFTYLAVLYLSHKSVVPKRNRRLYLFCTLLVSAHFVVGFTGPFDTIQEATKGIFIFGPLVTTLSAGLVYIPFRYRPATAGEDLELQAAVHKTSGNAAPSHEVAQHGCNERTGFGFVELDTSYDSGKIVSAFNHAGYAMPLSDSHPTPSEVEGLIGNGDLGIPSSIVQAVLGACGTQ